MAGARRGKAASERGGCSGGKDAAAEGEGRSVSSTRSKGEAAEEGGGVYGGVGAAVADSKCSVEAVLRCSVAAGVRFRFAAAVRERARV